MGHPLDYLEKVWIGSDLKGYRTDLGGGTYGVFKYFDLPPVPRASLASIDWLKNQPNVPYSLGDIDDRHPEPDTRATADNLEFFWKNCSCLLPKSFSEFISSPALQRKVRSGTYSFLDLGNFIVPNNGGGHLIHFMSDQQWICHWLLWVDNHHEAVVLSESPIGFHRDPGSPRDFVKPGEEADLVKMGSVVVSLSFTEFLYRFWIENEIAYFLSEGREPTPEQSIYFEHYKK